MAQRKEGRARTLRLCRKHLPFYVFLLLPLIQVIVFNYFPIYGIQIAFKDFKMRRGILGSEWVGLKHFEKMFSDPTFYRVLFNTLRLSILNMVTIFPITIVFALMMNEVNNAKFKRVTQTITYLPHFLSWVVVGGFVYQILSPSHGFVNAMLIRLGILEKPIYFMIQKEAFTPIYLIASIWKELGWSIIIYLAAIAGIDPSLYESAVIDGAGRLQKALHITIPAILPTISTLLILRLARWSTSGLMRSSTCTTRAPTRWRTSSQPTSTVAACRTPSTTTPRPSACSRMWSGSCWSSAAT